MHTERQYIIMYSTMVRAIVKYFKGNLGSDSNSDNEFGKALLLYNIYKGKRSATSADIKKRSTHRELALFCIENKRKENNQKYQSSNLKALHKLSPCTAHATYCHLPHMVSVCSCNRRTTPITHDC